MTDPTAPPLIQGYIDAAAAQYNVPAPILESMAFQESSYGAASNTYVPGPAGELGVMQTTPAIVSQYQINPYDPGSDISGGAHYLSDLFAKTGSWASAVKAYNGSGPAADAYSAQVMNRAAAFGFSDASTPPSLQQSILAALNPGAALIGSGGQAAGASLWASTLAWLETHWIMVLVIIGAAGLVLTSFGGLFKTPSGGPTIIPVPV